MVQGTANTSTAGPDKIVFPSGGLESAFADIRDAGMIESYVCGAGQGRWHSWQTVQSWAKTYEKERAHGRAVTALSYIDGREHPKKDDVFYCYACALWSGFVWAGTSGSDSRLLYRARLIQPRQERTETDGVHWRLYDHGLVAVNPTSKPLAVRLPLAEVLSCPVDLYSGQVLPVEGNTFEVSIPAESGRVFIDQAQAVRAYAEEARMAAHRLAGSLEDTAPAGPNWRVRDSAHSNGQGEVSVDSSAPHAGGACLRIVCAGDGNEVHASQGVRLNQREAQPIELSFYGRVEGDTTAHLAIGVQFADGTNTWWGTSPVRASKWTFERRTHTPPKPVAAVTVFCVPDYKKPGTAWFDGLSVRVVDGKGGFGANLAKDGGFELREEHEQRRKVVAAQADALDRAVAALRRGTPADERLRSALPSLLAAGDVSPYVGMALKTAVNIAVVFETDGGKLAPGGELPARITVRNGADRPMRIRELRLVAPDGFSADPGDPGQTLKLPPGAKATLPAKLHQARECTRPYAVFRATVVCELAEGNTCYLPAETTVWLLPALVMELSDNVICQTQEAPPAVSLRIANNSPHRLRGKVRIDAPKGLELKSAQETIEVPPGKETVVPVLVSSDDALQRGKHALTLKLLATDEKTSDRSLAYVPGAVGAPDAEDALKSHETAVLVVPAVTCRRCTRPPHLDGKLDDRCWQTTSRMTGFVLLDSAKPAVTPTTGYVTYDDEFLYVAVRCHKPLMTNLLATIQPGAPNESQAPSDDSVELYLDPGRTRKTYVRLVVNPNGAHKVTGQAKWKWACSKESDAWTVEMAVALSSLGARPQPGAVWGINLCRHDHRGTKSAGNELSGWAATYETFHEPRNFGLLMFAMTSNAMAQEPIGIGSRLELSDVRQMHGADPQR